MNLQDIKAFVAVAETGSIGRAAIRLNLTQPAMTRRVQNFETAIGTVLLDRSTKPPALTPAGQQILERCRRVLEAVAELEAFTSGVDEPAGDLRVGVAHGLAETVLTLPLDALRHRFARLTLQVSSNWTARLIEEVRGGDLDCAIGLITSDHVIPPGIRVIVAGTERIVVVGRREDAPRTPCSLSDLSGEGWVLNPAGCGCRTALQRAFERAKARLRVAAEVLGEDLQLSLIARSGGLGLVPWHQLEASPHRQLLRVVPVEDFTIEASVAMLRGPSLGKLATVVDVLTTAIADHLASIAPAHNDNK